MQLKRWQMVTLIALQLLFAACAASVLVYRARGWVSQVIDFGWLSYRAFNIYVSLALIGYLVLALLRRKRFAIPLLAAFSLFHLVDGVTIGFWIKAIIHLITLIILFGSSPRGRARHLRGEAGVERRSVADAMSELGSSFPVGPPCFGTDGLRP